jgi:hypothetical protein
VEFDSQKRCTRTSAGWLNCASVRASLMKLRRPAWKVAVSRSERTCTLLSPTRRASMEGMYSLIATSRCSEWS